MVGLGLGSRSASLLCWGLSMPADMPAGRGTAEACGSHRALAAPRPRCHVTAGSEVRERGLTGGQAVGLFLVYSLSCQTVILWPGGRNYEPFPNLINVKIDSTV